MKTKTYKLIYRNDAGQIETREIQARSYGDAWWQYPGCLTIEIVG